MPKGIYDRKGKGKGPQAVGAHLPKRLRLLPEDNASQPIQACAKLNARLTVSACATRFERAEAESKSVWSNRKYSVCEGCAIGEANAQAERERKVEETESVIKAFASNECDYCRGQGFYLIDGDRCVCECTVYGEVDP